MTQQGLGAAWTLVAWLSPMLGHVLCEIEEALENINAVDKYVHCSYKTQNQSRGVKRRPKYASGGCGYLKADVARFMLDEIA